MGRVLNDKGEPVPDAKVELWQANMHGRYTHPSDPNSSRLDPNFEGFGSQKTDSEGRFRFKTVKPGAYPTGVEGWTRPPDIHFDVTGRTDRLVTQVYFPGEPLNENDQLLKRIRRKDAVIVRICRRQPTWTRVLSSPLGTPYCLGANRCSSIRISSRCASHVGAVPVRGTVGSFNHLVGAGEERGRDREAERACGLEVDRKLEAFSLLHR